MSKFIEANEKIANTVVKGYKAVENSVVGSYRKVETSAVTGFGKVVDKCVKVLFAKKDESVEEAKKRLSRKA